MFTGTPAELADMQRRAQQIGAKIAALMGELEALYPGSTTAHAGQITGAGIAIRSIGGRWQLDTRGY